jgi:hypothetical protein
MSRLQYSVCKYEVESTGNCVMKVNFYLNYSYFNLVSNLHDSIQKDNLNEID